MRRSATLKLLPFLPLILGALLPAQERASAAAGASKAKAAEKTVVVPPGEISIAQLVEAAARASARNILCTESETSGQKPIALTEPVTLDPATCDDTLCNLLYTRGLAVVPVESGRGILEVINMAGPRGREVMAAAVDKTPEQVLAQPESKRPVMTTVRLQHVNAPVMVNMLRPFAGGQLGIGNVGNNEGLILRGIQRDVAAAVRMIQENDKPPGNAPGAGGPASAPADVAALVARMAAMEKQIEQLKQQVAALQQAAGK
jgi:type II secretory pathway component GspD/PulD (secretin)